LFILQNSGNIFDPFAVQVFIHAMGLYPGTIVELDKGEIGVVTRQNGDVKLLHPPRGRDRATRRRPRGA
jgi:HD-GYP domain-containing protein (c-di-GMP phosphodiesterase class II)